MLELFENLNRVRERMAAAAGRSGRPAEAVELIAVSKTHPVEVIRELARAPHQLFGESRVQEILAQLSDRTVVGPMPSPDTHWYRAQSSRVIAAADPSSIRARKWVAVTGSCPVRITPRMRSQRC